MTYALFDYVGPKGNNEIRSWSRSLAKKNLAKLNERLDKLFLYGEDLFPDVLSPTSVNGVLKLKCKGNVQLRPMLCRGPLKVGEEYTILAGAKEIGGVLDPASAPEVALDRKNQVVADPQKRRTSHERVG